MFPDPSDVSLGVAYGPTGVEYTGTKTTGFGNETVYTTMLRVRLDEPRLYLTTPEKRTTFTDRAATKPANAASDKVAYAHTEIAASYILSCVNSLTVLSVKR